jgi:acetylornithine deacetylase/succinyl-diaminopimelate desuccinylase-like protein
MSFDREAAKKILAQIGRDELAQLGCDLTSIPSPTGQGKAVAEFILAWFETNGLKAVRQEVEPDRPNAVELGIPGIKIGPRGRRISTRNEEIDIDVMMQAAKLYALIALDICSRPRPAA